MKEQLQAIVTVWSLETPRSAVAMFARSRKSLTHQQLADATKAVLATTVTITVSALIGTQLLHLFGESL